MTDIPTMICDYCEDEFPADARACCESGIVSDHVISEEERNMGVKEREEMKSTLGLTDTELDLLLETGEVSGLGAIVCLQCQAEMAKMHG